jgi:hypothetical protein
VEADASKTPRFGEFRLIEKLAFCATVLFYVITPLVICVILIGRMLGIVSLWLPLLITPIAFLASFFFFHLIDNSFSGRSLFERPCQQFLVAFALFLTALWTSMIWYVLDFWAATSNDLADEIFMLGIGGIFVVGFGVFANTPRGRAYIASQFIASGRMVAPTFLVIYGTWIISWFSCTTFVLYRHGFLDFLSSQPPQSPDEIMTFYIWHLLDTVPVLEITQTLRWTPPITYQDSAVGAWLLAFKIIFIVPAIALVLQYLRAPDVAPGTENQAEAHRDGGGT